MSSPSGAVTETVPAFTGARLLDETKPPVQSGSEKKRWITQQGIVEGAAGGAVPAHPTIVILSTVPDPVDPGDVTFTLTAPTGFVFTGWITWTYHVVTTTAVTSNPQDTLGSLGGRTDLQVHCTAPAGHPSPITSGSSSARLPLALRNLADSAGHAAKTAGSGRCTAELNRHTQVGQQTSFRASGSADAHCRGGTGAVIHPDRPHIATGHRAWWSLPRHLISRKPHSALQLHLPPPPCRHKAHRQNPTSSNSLLTPHQNERRDTTENVIRASRYRP